MGGFFLFQLYADTIGNTFKFYATFNWYDKFTHFSGGAMGGVLTFLILEYLNKKNQWRLGVKTLIIFAVSLTLTLAVLYEFWEFFAYSVLNDKQIIIGVTDTADDLLFGFLGAVASIMLLAYVLKKQNYFLPNSIDSRTK